MNEEGAGGVRRANNRGGLGIFCVLKSEKGQNQPLEYAFIAVVVVLLLFFLMRITGVSKGMASVFGRVDSALEGGPPQQAKP